MTTENENAPAQPPANDSSSSRPPAPVAPVQSSGGGGGSDGADYWKAQFEQARDQRDEFKGKLRQYEEKGHEELASENEALKQQLAAKAEAEAKAIEQLQERDRADTRRQFVDAILTRVPEGKRNEVRLMLSGLEQAGELSIPDESPTEAAEAAITKLADSYPGWFSSGSGGLGTPAGPGAGPLPEDFMDLSEEQQRSLSDEDFSKHYGHGRQRKKRKTLLG